MGERRLAAPAPRSAPRARGAAPPPPPSPARRSSTSPLAQVRRCRARRVLGRVGRRLGFFTVRDLLFHLPRRYDDLREMRKLGDLVWVEDGTVVSARVRVADVRVEASFRRRVQRTIAVLEDETGTIEATWFGRRYIERRLHPGDRVIVSRQAQALRPEADARQPGLPARGQRGRAAPRRADRAGLPADRRADGGHAAARGPRRARPRRQGLPRVPAAGARPRGEAVAADRRGARGGPLPDVVRAAATRRCERLAFDELLALQLGMVGRRRQRGARRGAADRRSTTPTTRASAAALEGVARRESSAARSTLTRGPGRGDPRHPRRPRPRRRRCSACSRATSARARPRSRRRRSRPRRAAGHAGRAPRADGPARPAAPPDARRRCSRTPALPVELLTGSLTAAASADQTLELVASGHGAGRRRDARADPGARGVRRLGARRHRRAAPVRRRAARPARGEGRRRRAPHVLLMTATPIPRTLGQVLYADLDVSDLRTPPEGRVPIRTGIRRPGRARRRRGRRSARRRRPGHRTFVVVPLIDEADADRRRRRRPASTGRRRRSSRARPRRAVAAEAGGRAAARAARAAPGRAGPRPAEGRRPRRRDGPLPRRRARRARRDDRRRGRRRRARGDDDGHRGRRSVRARPAPPAPRPRRARDGRVVLRARLGLRPTRPPRPGSRRSPRPARRLRARRARLGAAPRGRRAGPRPERPAAPPRRVAPARRPPRARDGAREPPRRRCSTTRGELRPGHEALARELAERLARARRPGRAGRAPPEADGAVGRPTSATARTAPGGSSPASARGRRLAAPGEGTRPLGDRVKQSAVRDPRAEIRGRRVPRPLRGQRRGGHRGAVARRRAAPCSWNATRGDARPSSATFATTGLAGPTRGSCGRRSGTWFNTRRRRRWIPRAPRATSAVRGDPRRPALRPARAARPTRSRPSPRRAGWNPRARRRRRRQALLEAAAGRRPDCYDRPARPVVARLRSDGRDRPSVAFHEHGAIRASDSASMPAAPLPAKRSRNARFRISAAGSRTASASPGFSPAAGPGGRARGPALPSTAMVFRPTAPWAVLGGRWLVRRRGPGSACWATASQPPGFFPRRHRDLAV